MHIQVLIKRSQVQNSCDFAGVTEFEGSNPGMAFPLKFQKINMKELHIDPCHQHQESHWPPSRQVFAPGSVARPGTLFYSSIHVTSRKNPWEASTLWSQTVTCLSEPKRTKSTLLPPSGASPTQGVQAAAGPVLPPTRGRPAPCRPNPGPRARRQRPLPPRLPGGPPDAARYRRPPTPAMPRAAGPGPRPPPATGGSEGPAGADGRTRAPPPGLTLRRPRRAAAAPLPCGGARSTASSSSSPSHAARRRSSSASPRSRPRPRPRRGSGIGAALAERRRGPTARWPERAA